MAAKWFNSLDTNSNFNLYIFNSTAETTTVQTTTELIATTDGGLGYEPTTTGCTIDGFEADENGNCFKVVTTKLNWSKVNYVTGLFLQWHGYWLDINLAFSKTDPDIKQIWL